MRRQKREKEILTNSKIKIPTNDKHNKEQRTERSLAARKKGKKKEEEECWA